MKFTQRNPHIHAWPVADVIALYRDPRGGSGVRGLKRIDPILAQAFDDGRFTIADNLGQTCVYIEHPDGDDEAWFTGWLVLDDDEIKVFQPSSFWDLYKEAS